MNDRELADFISRNMTDDERAAFIKATEGERRVLASRAMERHCDQLRSYLAKDPLWTAASRMMNLDFLLTTRSVDGKK